MPVRLLGQRVHLHQAPRQQHRPRRVAALARPLRLAQERVGCLRELHAQQGAARVQPGFPARRHQVAPVERHRLGEAGRGSGERLLERVHVHPGRGIERHVAALDVHPATAQHLPEVVERPVEVVGAAGRVLVGPQRLDGLLPGEDAARSQRHEPEQVGRAAAPPGVGRDGGVLANHLEPAEEVEAQVGRRLDLARRGLAVLRPCLAHGRSLAATVTEVPTLRARSRATSLPHALPTLAPRAGLAPVPGRGHAFAAGCRRRALLPGLDARGATWSGSSRGTWRACGPRTGPGSPLPVTRLDKHRFSVAAGGAAAVVVRYRLFANELTVRTCHLDGTHGYLNGAAAVPLRRRVAWRSRCELEVVAARGLAGLDRARRGPDRVHRS